MKGDAAEGLVGLSPGTNLDDEDDDEEITIDYDEK